MERNKIEPGPLMPTLHAAQKIFGCIPLSDMVDSERFFCRDMYNEMKRKIYSHLPSWVYRYEFDTNENVGVVYQSGTNKSYPLIIKK